MYFFVLKMKRKVKIELIAYCSWIKIIAHNTYYIYTLNTYNLNLQAVILLSIHIFYEYY